MSYDKEQCAQYAGSHAWTGRFCITVYGEQVDIKEKTHSIEEGFRHVNRNFHTGSGQPSVPTQEDLPGAVDI